MRFAITPILHAPLPATRCGCQDSYDPTWSVSSSDKTDTINAGAQQVCTYRVAVNAGKPAVKVIVRNSSGNQVSSTTVEGGNSADFDLAVGQSLHVEYINAASDGTYQKL
ncbi:MAG: hypothetical protein JNK49_20850 [Planctomycetes bacterium]|nr:hypothetical protein [Planctomycetota bacterium]